MKKITYKIEIEYSDHPAEHPIAVYVYMGKELIFDGHGKDQSKILKEAFKAIKD
jgi:hypothetical protein